MKKYFSQLVPAACIAGITVLLFWQFFFKGLLPFPGEFMLAWFEPWKSDYSQNGNITVPHKPISDDVFRQYYPFKVLAMDMLKKGQLPLWNPYNGAGQPLFATMHVGIMNPLNILFFMVDNKIAWSLQVVLSVFGVGLSTYLFANKIGMKKTGSLFSSIIFMLSGFVIVRSIYNDYNFGVICLPLLLYLIEDYVTNKGKKVLFLPIVIFFLTSVVQPQIIVYVCGFAGIYFLTRTRFTEIKLSRRDYSFLLLLILCGILLSSIQLLPTFELYKHANVTTDSSRFIIERFLLPLSHFVTILIPNYFGNQATYNYWGAGDYIETITTVGTIPIFFAIVALIHSTLHKSLKIFFITTISVSLIMTLKFFGTDFLYSLPIPVLSTGIPARILFIPVFCFALLAGFGIETLSEMKKKTASIKRILLLYSVIIAGILLITWILQSVKFSCHNGIITNCWNIALRNTLFEAATFSLCCLLIGIYLKQYKMRRLVMYGIMLLVIGVGFYNAQKFLPFSPIDHVMPKHTLLTKIKTASQSGRTFGFGQYNIKTNLATYYKFFDTNYYDPLYIKRYGELVQFATDPSHKKQLPRSDVEIPNDQNLSYDNTIRRERLLSLLGVNTYITSSSTGAQLITNTANKRVFIAKKVTNAPNDEQNLETLFDKNFNTQDDAIVEKNIPLPPTAKGTAKISSYQENTVIIQAETNTDSLLVLTDNYFPGWKAYDNGKEIEVLRVNYTLRGVNLSAGRHRVTFIYEPDSVRFGAYMSLIGLILFTFIGIFWPKIRSNKN